MRKSVVTRGRSLTAPGPRRTFAIGVFASLCALIATACSPPSLGYTGTNRGAGYDRMGFYPCTGDGPTVVGCIRSLSGWLGRNTSPSLPYVTLMTDATDPNTMAGNGWGAMVQAGALQTLSPHPTLVISVPLAFTVDCGFGPTKSTCFDKEAAGAYDSDYRQLIQYFINGGYARNIIIRLGWEYDGNWMPWSAQTNFGQFKAAYRHVHDLMKGMIPSLKFDLAGDSLLYMPTNQVQNIWNQAYPGPGYVDIVGMDVYYAAVDYPNFSSYLPYLQLQERYAKSIGASVSYPEWGQKQKADTPSFIQGMSDWFDSLPLSGPGHLEYQTYFDADTTDTEGANGAHMLFNDYTSTPVAPNSAALFKRLFGGTSTPVHIPASTRPPSQTPPAGGTAKRYEAENAARNIPSEARWGGYSGAGYVCCWQGDGQYVSTTVNVATAGRYNADFRYSAGNGVASRTLVVNGATVNANLQLAATPNWSSWADSASTVTLKAGPNTIMLVYLGNHGSHQYVNLDYLELSPA